MIRTCCTARSTILSILILLLLAALPGDAHAAPAGDDDLAERLARLEALLEQKRVEHHVPGMSVVVVHDGRPVLARGFGVVDLDTGEAATATTPFMIGSTTKAFTATLIGMLVDEGKVEWDAPVARYLPYFTPRVDSDDPDAAITIRDALSHRSGFSRMGMLITAQGVSPEDVLTVASRAEPYDGFREAFHYNNVMYLAAGTAAAEAAGSDWHRLIRKRIFKPLGMKRSTTLSSKSKDTLHRGYGWLDDLEEYQRQPILPVEAAAPAGSIVSNAEDMGRWIAFLIDGGVHDGKRLISEEALAETWHSNVAIADGFGYGMGWMVREWDGRRMVEHGGNIHGFAAQVGLLPDDGWGFALMTNLTATPLQQESLHLVFSTLLGEEETETPGTPAGGEGDLSAFTGEFVANFGPFEDATFAVTEKDGKLFVDVPGQTNYELRPPGEDGRRPFAVTDTVAVSFEVADDGSVDLMRMHQAGLDFELPRRGVAIEPEIDVAELEPFVGAYESPTSGNVVKALIRNHRLALDIPGQMVFELHLPDDDGRRAFRVRDELSARFATGDDGRITALVLERAGETLEELPRIVGEDEEPLPTIDALMERRATDERRAAAEAFGGSRIVASVKLVNAGLEGTTTTWTDGERYRSETDFGRFGRVNMVVTPDEGAMETHATPLEPIRGRRLAAMLELQRFAYELDWRPHYDSIRVEKREAVGDREAVVVRLQSGDDPAVRAYLDESNGDLLRFETRMPIPGTGAELPITIELDDYREIGGLRIPYVSRTENPESGHTVTRVTSFERGIEVCDALFDLVAEPTCAAR